MQGLFVYADSEDELRATRPKSKKQVRELIKADPHRVYVEATSVFGNEYDGPVSDMPAGSIIAFVGPDPYTKRNFYGQLIRRPDGSFLVK